MAQLRQTLFKWLPVLLLVPIGIAVPFATAAFAQSRIRDMSLSNAVVGLCSLSEGQTIENFAMLIAWNFAPYAALMVVLVILIRQSSKLSTWLTFIAGVTSTVFVFSTMHIKAEELLLKEAWTASSLASGLASLYALAVSFVLAIMVGTITWAIQERFSPSNNTVDSDARNNSARGTP